MLAAGSTGAPKGVLCCHEGIVNAMDFEISMRRKCGLGKDDPVIQTMAVFADMSGEGCSVGKVTQGILRVMQFNMSVLGLLLRPSCVTESADVKILFSCILQSWTSGFRWLWAPAS